MNTNLEGRVAIVTGGSRGIGKAIALALATEGVRIALSGRDELALDQTKHELEDRLHADVQAMKANITRANDVRRLVESTIRKFGRIDILVNNAGGAAIGGIHQASDDDWEEHVAVKLLGTVRMCREVIPHMRKHGGGRIVIVAGTVAKEPDPYYMIPGVLNAALLNFTKVLSRELEQDNIFVNAVSPGMTDTALRSQNLASIAELSHRSLDELRRKTVEGLPAGRFVKPEEVAQAVVFLASDAAGFVNGSSITVDGGGSFSSP